MNEKNDLLEELNYARLSKLLSGDLKMVWQYFVWDALSIVDNICWQFHCTTGQEALGFYNQ